MKNICFCFQMHAPYRLKRYRFFEIGQDHYYYDDMATEEYITWLTQTSYLPLCRTIQEMINLSKNRFHCALAVSGTMLELFEQFVPEMIDVLKDLAGSKCVEFVRVPYSYSLAAQCNSSEMEMQINAHAKKMKDVLGVSSATLWNTELLYSDEIAGLAWKMGYKTIMTEGAKHILSYKSSNYLYSTCANNKQSLLMRNAGMSDALSFHFSDPNWHEYPMDAEKYANKLASLPEEEQLVNLWMGAETFGVLQPGWTGIFEFLKALPYYVIEQNMTFLTPSEAAKQLSTNEPIVSPYPLTWTGEGKDLSTFLGNDLQQEATNKFYAVTERVHLCEDKSLKRDWMLLQDVNYLHYMNHIDQGSTTFESAYDAFINYMNILSDFLQRVDEQYPTTIENEELNSLLKTITNQEKEIASLNAEIKKLKKKK
ncbi:MAG: glycoside hydrolase family 57 protein [Paludibacteraceae bacterium]|nr:glycoside hydrolase family 57 protein [Paludibacteraceae bacterium]